MAAHLKLTPELREVFLKILAASGQYITACDEVGINMSTLARHRKADPAFNDACEDALERHRALIEAEILRRSIEGVEEPFYTRNGEVGTVRKFSDQLLALYAKRHIKHYRDSVKVEQHVTGRVDVGLEAIRELAPPLQERLRSILIEAGDGAAERN
jgi:hypothetical protein